MDPNTADKLMHRVNLHTVAKTPTRSYRPSRKLAVSKPPDFLSQYQEQILQEKEIFSTGKFAYEQTMPYKKTSISGFDSDLDPVQDNFIRALRQKLDSYINKAPGLRESEQGKERRKAARWQPMRGSSNGINSPQFDIHPVANLQQTSPKRQLPSISSPSGAKKKGKASLLDVFKNQLIRNACKTTHCRTRSLFQALDPKPLPSEISSLCSNFKQSLDLRQRTGRSLNTSVLDVTGPTVKPPATYRVRNRTITSRYDSRLPPAKRRMPAYDPYQMIESLRERGSSAMDQMYATVMSEFQLDSKQLPDDLKGVEHLGKYNVFNYSDCIGKSVKKLPISAEVA